jgi:hypothetical protein
VIDLRLQQEQVMVGEMLKGSLAFYPDSPKTVKEAIVTLGWHTEGRGSGDEAKIQEMVFDASHFPGGSGMVSFQLQIPVEGPISIEGQLIRIIWQVSVKLDLAGMFAKDLEQQQLVRVLPRSVRS